MKNILVLSFLFIGIPVIASAQDTLTECKVINADEDNSLLNVFPNPTDGTFKITYASQTECPPPGWGGELLISVLDFNGKVVFTERISEFEDEYIRIVDLSLFEKGTYIVEVVAGKQKWVKREVLK